MKIKSIWVVLLLVPLLGRAGETPQDSLVRWANLDFIYADEREAFRTMLEKPSASAYFELFYRANRPVTGSTIEQSEAKIDELLSEFRSTKWMRKPARKRVDAVQQKIHETLFTRYELRNHFSDVFTGGRYNCVSASALFAVCFEKLDIPYQVMEAPAHVYLTANPGSDRMIVETTDPVRGYYRFTERFKNNFRNHLLDSKLISEEEYYALSTEELFDKYYFAEQAIDIRQLLGLQYINLGIYAFEDERYPEALSLFKRSYVLYPNEKNKYLLLRAAMTLAQQSNFDRIEDTDHLILAARFLGRGVQVEQLNNFFYRITDRHLINSTHTGHYEDIYNRLMEQVKDTAFREAIGYQFNLEMARAYLTRSRISQAQPYLQEAIRIRPENRELHALVIHMLSQQVSGMSGPDEAAEVLSQAEEQYPFVKEHGLFKEMKLEVYLWNASVLFDQNNRNRGRYFLDQFEQVYQEDRQLSVTATSIVRAYADGAASYFRLGRKDMARNLVTKGLDYVPASHELKRRLEMLR